MNEKKYFVIYEKGDSFGGDEPFDSKEQAIEAAERQWANLTSAEKKACNLFVAIGELDDDGILDTMTGYDVIVQYPTRKWEVLEDNSGGLHLAVFDLENDGVEYIHSGYETAGDQLLEDIKLLKSGEADPVNDWDGNAEDPQVIYDELVNSRETSIVSDDDGVYYSKMGNSAASILETEKMNNGLMVRMEIALQLLKMDDRQLFRLHNLIEEYAPDNDIIDILKFLPCDKCREKYGECSEETSDCESRFIEFCEEEAP